MAGAQARSRVRAGLVADEHAEFWTPPLHLHGSTLRLNAKTGEGGSIRVALQDESFTPLPNHTLPRSPLTGNHLKHPITWGQTTRIPTTCPLVLRLQLNRAILFCFEVVA